MSEAFLIPGHYQCPSCMAPEKSFSVYQHEARLVIGKCHRASCGYAVRFPLVATPSAPTPKPSREYRGAFIDPTAMQDAIAHQFDVDSLGICCAADKSPLLPVRAPSYGLLRGYMKRAIWWGQKGTGPKTVAYPNDNYTGPWQAWYGVASSLTVIVEDQISAMKVAQTCGLVRSVALLGSDLTQDKVREIARHAQDVIIALDADATEKAFDLARKWGMAFHCCRVAILECDLKDTPRAEIARILGLEC